MTPNSLAFRLATPDDAAPLVRLINTAFSADTTTQVFLFADHAIVDVTDTPSILAKIADAACTVLVAADTADPAGTPLVAHCSVRKPDDFGGRACAWFGLLAVDAGFQGRGFGVQALAWAEGYAQREWGARRMEFDVVGTRAELELRGMSAAGTGRRERRSRFGMTIIRIGRGF